MDEGFRVKTLEEIVVSLNEVGKFCHCYGQLVRAEVHGNHTWQLPNMKAIFDLVTEPDVRMCWNCNDHDLLYQGLGANFNMVRKWFGDTVHMRELTIGDYPYQELSNLFKKTDYNGWILLEARTKPADRITAMKEQLEVFRQMTK